MISAPHISEIIKTIDRKNRQILDMKNSFLG